MLLRRLADLSFMFQLYPLAYDVYHMLKRDFESDKAWLYSAGAQVSNPYTSHDGNFYHNKKEKKRYSYHSGVVSEKLTSIFLS